MTASAGPALILDRFQLEAVEHLDAGRSVLVAAPTGAGKTLIAEHAIELALSRHERAFYTAPIKALSNQKFQDFVDRYGAARVGLLTGDNVINPDADLVVMTTEVLRNMLYAGRPLKRLSVVVLDEVHYLEDSFRGPVWEEVILNLPDRVVLVCLSATVSNTDELGGWLTSVRGPTGVVVETERPVELVNLYAVGDRRGNRLHVLPTLVDHMPNPEGHRFDAERGRSPHRRPRARKPWRTPKRLELIELLSERDLLPLIWFVFSRKGCDEAARATARSGLHLTSAEEAGRIRVIAEGHLSRLDPADLDILDTSAWLADLERGVAAHHAGLVPAFKETIERCFAEGLVRVVFATETLALGVNLPARCVVIDRLTKFTGEVHEALTPGQFTQLTGRAGRRGLDERGHAVVPWSPFTAFSAVAALASSKTFRLRSAFRPTYNMTANLLARLDAESARQLLARSFAQYQADAGVSRTEQTLARERRRLAALRADAASADESSPEAGLWEDPAVIADRVSQLRPGDVIRGERGDKVAVIGVSWRRGGRARIRLVDQGGHDLRWELSELDHSPLPVGRIELPFPLVPDRPSFRTEVAASLRRVRVDEKRGEGRIRARDSADVARQVSRIEREIAAREKRARRDESSIARRFDAVASVLRERGHLDGWELTEPGHLVARIYHESDLLIAESLTAGLLDGLDPPTLASVASVFTHEHRSPTPPPAVWFPAKSGRTRFDSIEKTAAGLRRCERHHGVTETRPPEAGFAVTAHAWASGRDLSTLLDEDLSAGDFVRNVKQLTDLLRQIASAAPDPATRRAGAAAAEAMHRGVVALSGALD